MLTINLEAMKQTDIRSIDRDSLADIEDIIIRQDLPKQERIMDFVRQIKNPYCFKCGDMVVKLSFMKEEKTLEEKLEELYSSS